MSNLYVYVEVDENDGDYIGDLKPIDTYEAERLEALIAKSGDNLEKWQYGECADVEPEEAYPDFTEDDIDFINEQMPSPEYGFHTVVKIQIVSMVKKLL
ncbi:hypothetical protein NVP1081O_060 [Vibrio phage 1.081.O._10N.286.52.C2]|nr:hypothetical protein NVP1081O_060 [Vibrio phage 1.081.O._10N.286.52.C2]